MVYFSISLYGLGGDWFVGCCGVVLGVVWWFLC